MMRKLLLLVVLAAACLACQEPLEGMGGFSSGWVRGEEEAGGTTATTEAAVEAPADAFRSAREVEWVNDGFGVPEEASSTRVLGRVLTRAGEGERFVQASRQEIVLAVPGVRFPESLPAEVGYVTSQLVFTPDLGGLDPRGMAAFGLWTARPYSVSRTVGQAAVLTAAEAAAVPIPQAGGTPCDGYDPGAGTCEGIRVGSHPGWLVSGEAEQRVVWTDGEYRYEPVCRLAATTCQRSAESAIPLAELVQEP